MKLILTVTAVLLSIELIHSQTLSSNVIDINNVKANVSNNGIFFHDFNLGVGGYEVPKESGTHLMYSSSFWFAGLLSNNEIAMAANQSGVIGNDFYPGPIANNYQLQSYLDAYEESIWQITQEEINTYSVWWNACDANSPTASTTACNALSTTQIPTNELLAKINSWPAHGNTDNGEMFYLAPFTDNNTNPNNTSGIYEPEQGDVPKIKGCSAVFMILNDDAGPHTATGASKLKLELHYLIHQYETENDLNNTTIVELTMYNRSAITYTDFVVSNFMDGELGGTYDDYFGSNPERNLAYYYNGDNVDDSDAGTLGYGANPPSFGIMCLNDSVTAMKTMNGSLPGDAFTVGSNYNQMLGKNGDGSLIFNDLNQPTRYMYSGNPSVNDSYSELQLGNTFGERRSLLSVKIGDFPPSYDEGIGFTLPVRLTFAIIYSRTGDHLQNVNSLFDVADDIQDFYDVGMFECNDGNIGLTNIEENEIGVFPNPTSNNLQISINSEESYSGKIIGLDGKVLQEFTTSGTTTSVNCAQLKPGMYMLQLTNGTKFVTKQFVKVD